MRILVSGGTGLIGTALVEDLLANGNQVICLSRTARPSSNANLVYNTWDDFDQLIMPKKFDPVDGIINLAGESIGSGRWTRAKKERIEQSRVEAGRKLSLFAIQQNPHPQFFVQASAVGIYGTDPERLIDEESPAGDDYLAAVARRWEESTAEVELAGIPRTIIRMGVVLDPVQGALPRMVLPFNLFSGGPIGTGNQWVSWIHLKDVVNAIQFLIKNKKPGTYNLVSPNPTQNSDFGKSIAHVLHRPYWMPVPGWALRLVLGEMSTLVLDGQKVLPKKLLYNGYRFLYPELEAALQDLFMA